MPARPLPNHPGGGATSPTPPGSDHALPDEYDVDLLARAPSVTQEQRQAGYDTGLLSSAAGRQAQPTPHSADPGNEPTSPRYGGGGYGAPLPGRGGRASSTEKFDPASAGHYLAGGGGGDERAVYSPIGDRRRETYETQNGNRMSQLGGPGMGQGAMAASAMGATPSDDYEKPHRGRANGAGGYGGRGGGGRTGWRPWYRRPTGLALIVAAIALLIVVIVVPIAVTQTKSTGNTDTSVPSSSGSFTVIPSDSSSSPLAGEGPTVSSNGAGHSTSSPTALASAGSGVNSSGTPAAGAGQGGATHEGGGPISLRALPTLAPR